MYSGQAAQGYSSPLSAISKNAARKGKQLDNMDDGWIDMEVADDEDVEEPSGNPKSGKSKGKNSNKKRTDDDDDDDDDDE
jgi:hypothetical protein